jgi:hypothetical protein
MEPDVIRTLVEVGAAGWLVAAVHNLTSEVRAFRVTLFGETGQNGLNSRVKDLEFALDEQHDRITELQQREV